MALPNRRFIAALVASISLHVFVAVTAGVFVWPTGQWPDLAPASVTAPAAQATAESSPVQTALLADAAAPPPGWADQSARAVASALTGLVTHVWQSTLFACAVGLMTMLFRQQQSRVRHWLWVTASLKFFVPFALLVALGRALPSPAWPHALSDALAGFDSQLRPAWLWISVSAAEPSTRTTWLLLAVAVWVLGFAVVAAFRLAAWRRVRHLLRRSHAVANTGLSPAGVEVRAAPGLLEPGVVGILRPIILLPDGIDRELAFPQLRAVVAHEMCHVERRDTLIAWLHMQVEAVYWWHPMVWWIGGRLVDERERACDQALLERGYDPDVYARGIVAVCRRYVETGLPSVAGVSGSNVKARVEAILRRDVGRPVDRWRKLLLVTTAALLVAMPVCQGVMTAGRDLSTAQGVYVLKMSNAGQYGPRLRPAAADCSTSAPAEAGPVGTLPASGASCGAFGFAAGTNFALRTGGMAFRGLTMGSLAAILSPILGRPVVDRTGLTGHFDGDFDFVAEIPLPPPPPGQPRPSVARPRSIWAVFPEQLGLTFTTGQALKEN